MKVIILINLPVPSIRSVATATDLDDLSALDQIIQRTLDGSLAHIRTLRHDLCLCDLAEVIMDDVADTVWFASILADDFDPVRKIPVGCENDTQLVSDERNVVVFFFVPAVAVSCLPFNSPSGRPS